MYIMKKLTLNLSVLFVIVMASLLSCNSNAQPTNSVRPPRGPIEPAPTSEVGYRATGKESYSAHKLTLSSAFNNDYYTSTAMQGSFYAEIKADNYERRDKQRVPLNLSIVIDRSGSMSGEKIQRAKESAQYIVDQLTEGDYISVVAYDTDVKVVIPATSVGNKSYLKSAIAGIQDRGGTNLCGGAVEGYAQVQKKYNRDYVNRVVLLSDGLANEGITDPIKIEQIVKKQLYQNGISISTFGIGRDYNEDLMTAMAETGNGNYYFIDNAKDIAGIFEKELNGLSQVVAQNVQLKITLPENVNVDKVYGARYEQHGRVLTMDVRDMFSQETKAILVKYTINRNTNTTIAFTSNLTYKQVDNSRMESLRTNNKQEYTSSYNTYQQYFNEWVMAQDILYKSNETLEQAMREADKGNYDNARKLVKENDGYMSDNAPLVNKSKELQKAKTVNTEYQTRMATAESMDAETKKVVQKASKASNYELRGKK